MPEKMSRKEIILAQIEAQYKSIADFARKTGIPDGTIRNIKNRPDESIDNMAVGQFVKICQALHLDAEELIEGRLSMRPNIQKEAVIAAYKQLPLDLDGITERDLSLLDLIRRLPEDQKSLLQSLLQGISPPPP